MSTQQKVGTTKGPQRETLRELQFRSSVNEAMKYAVLLSLAYATLPSAAQDWEPAGLPLSTLYIKHLDVDTVGDALYFSGLSEHVPWGGWDISLCRYRDGQWDTLGLFNAPLSSAVNYHDTLVVSGQFTFANGQTCNGMACYDGASWHPYGQFNDGVKRLRILNGELYAVGAFSVVDGLPVYGIVKRVGGEWQPPHPFPSSFAGIAGEMMLYNGELYVGGSFDFNGSLNDIMRYNGTEWTDVGGSLLGGISAVNCMVVYNGQLIVGGSIPIQAGNAGNNIMAWDGSNWHPLGAGFSDAANSYNGVSAALGMTVYDGKLYVAGSQFHAGGIPAQGIAQWDGYHWCNVGHAYIRGGCWDVAFFHDTLYVAPYDSIDGQDMNRAARWIGGSFSDTCSTAMAIASNIIVPPACVTFDTASRTITLSLNNTTTLAAGTLLDATGRLVARASGSTLYFDMRSQPNGLYLVQVPGYPASRVLVE